MVPFHRPLCGRKLPLLSSKCNSTSAHNPLRARSGARNQSRFCSELGSSFATAIALPQLRPALEFMIAQTFIGKLPRPCTSASCTAIRLVVLATHDQLHLFILRPHGRYCSARRDQMLCLRLPLVLFSLVGTSLRITLHGSGFQWNSLQVGRRWLLVSRIYRTLAKR